RAGFKAPQFLHGVLIEGRYLAHDVAHEEQAAVGAQHAGIGRIVGLKLLHGVAGAHIDAAEQAVAYLAVGIAHAALDRLHGVLFSGDAAVNFTIAGADELFGRIGGPRVEIVGFADHGVEIGDAARRIVRVRHQRRHAIMGGANVDRFLAVPDRFAGIVLNGLGCIVVDRPAS